MYFHEKKNCISKFEIFFLTIGVWGNSNSRPQHMDVVINQAKYVTTLLVLKLITKLLSSNMFQTINLEKIILQILLEQFQIKSK